MIHIISQHLGRGSYAAWYDILNFNEPYIHHKFDDYNDIENKIPGFPPYLDNLINKLDFINPQKSDIVILDLEYIFNFDYFSFKKDISELSKKYNNCKFIFFEDDNLLPYEDTDCYTIFSNRFYLQQTKVNCNYYRFRSSLQGYLEPFEFVINKFMKNYRQKKLSMIVGVDKKERLQTFKYIYNIGLNNDSWLGYSAFTSNYDDSELSNSLIKFKNEKIPIRLDSNEHIYDINVEMPPLPITMTSYISCILETHIFVGDEIHLSEKSWNPFISKNIPLILGSTHINTYLKQLGFWLADDLFDLTPQFSVESILQQYRNNLDIINKMKIEDLHAYYIKNKNNINSNFNLLQNQKFIFDRNNYK